jgi:hypothetical protein
MELGIIGVHPLERPAHAHSDLRTQKLLIKCRYSLHGASYDPGTSNKTLKIPGRLFMREIDHEQELTNTI